MQTGDWYIREHTGQLFQVGEITPSQVELFPIEDIQRTLGEPIFTTSFFISNNYTFCPEEESVDDIVAEYANYDYNRKFYRIQYVSLACRLTRAWSHYDSWEGSYEVTPSDIEQILAVAGYKMKEDLTIHRIPYKEVTNVSGTTVHIG